LVDESNAMVVSAYEAFAFDLDLDELQDTLLTIATSCVVLLGLWLCLRRCGRCV
jgi:hypothetical protein